MAVMSKDTSRYDDAASLAPFDLGHARRIFHARTDPPHHLLKDLKDSSAQGAQTITAAKLDPLFFQTLTVEIIRQSEA